MSDAAVWETLGIAATSDSLAIRRAYTVKLKVTNPEDDAEGFKVLRAAYEAALQWASVRSARAAQPAPSPAPAARTSAQPGSENPDAHEAHELAAPQPQVDPEIADLQAAFASLNSALVTPEPSTDARAGEALAAFVQSPALANINVEREAERRLAELLAATLPRSDALLVDAAKRFGWLNAGLRATAAVNAVLGRINDLAFLESVQRKDSSHFAAFRGLQRRKVPVWSWLRAHFQRGGFSGEYQLLQMLRLQHPSLLPLLNAETLAWWDRLASRPRVSQLLILLGLAAGVVLLGVAWLNEAPLVLGLWGLGLPVGFAFGKLYLHDWPRFLIARKWPAGLPAWLACGWLPLGVMTLAASAAAIERPMLARATFVAGLFAALWVVIVRTPFPGGLNYLGVLVCRQVLLAVWWLGSTEQLPPGIIEAMWLPVFALAFASTIGAERVRTIWLRDLSFAQQRASIALVTLLTVVTASLLWVLAPTMEWRPACAALVVSVIALHRPLTSALTQAQQKARLAWTSVAIFLWIFATILEPMAAEVRARGAMFTGGGLILLTTCMLGAALAAWNDLRSHNR